jgi:hypothetical protein
MLVNVKLRKSSQKRHNEITKRTQKTEGEKMKMAETLARVHTHTHTHK